MDRELIKYLPNIVQEIKDYEELMKTEQIEIERLWDRLKQGLDNQFIMTTDEAGISLYELMFNIKPKATDELDIRQFRILTKYNEHLPYTYLKLIEQLKALCGENGIKTELNGYSLKVKVELTAKDKVEEVRKLLESMVPANIVFDVLLLYNQWKSVKSLTWGEVKEKTWTALRNEVI